MNGVQTYAGSAAVHAAQATPFTVYTNTDPVVAASENPKDRDLASGIIKALYSLQEALDAAALSGLIVEPSFKSYPNRFKDRGSDADSYVAKVEVYRKLA